MERIAKEANILGHKWIVEAEFFSDFGPFCRGDAFAHHFADRITEIVFDGESYETDDQHDDHRLKNSFYCKCKHGLSFSGFRKVLVCFC